MATPRNLYLGIGGSLASNLEQPSSTPLRRDRRKDVGAMQIGEDDV